MKANALIIILSLALLLGCATGSENIGTEAENPEMAAIQTAVDTYAEGLNQRSTDLVASVFDDTGEFTTYVDYKQQIVSKDVYLGHCPVKFDGYDSMSMDFKMRLTNMVIEGDEAHGILTMKYISPTYSGEDKYALGMVKKDGKWWIKKVIPM